MKLVRNVYEACIKLVWSLYEGHKEINLIIDYTKRFIGLSSYQPDAGNES